MRTSTVTTAVPSSSSLLLGLLPYVSYAVPDHSRPSYVLCLWGEPQKSSFHKLCLVIQERVGSLSELLGPEVLTKVWKGMSWVTLSVAVSILKLLNGDFEVTSLVFRPKFFDDGDESRDADGDSFELRPRTVV